MSNQGDGLFVGALYSSLAELEYAVNSWAVHNATKLGLRSGSAYGEDQLRRWVCESWAIPSLACKFKDCLLDIEAVCLPLQNCWRIVTFSPQHISEAQWEEWTSFDLLRQIQAMQTYATPSQNDRNDTVTEDNPTPAGVPRRTDDNGCNVEHGSMPGPSSLRDRHSIRTPQPGEQLNRSCSLATGDATIHIEGNRHTHDSSVPGREAPMVHGNTFDEDMPPLDDNLPLDHLAEDIISNEAVVQADSDNEAIPELIDSNARSKRERSYSFSSTLTPLSSDDEAQTPNSSELKQKFRVDIGGSSEPRKSANKRQLSDSRILSQDVRGSGRAKNRESREEDAPSLDVEPAAKERPEDLKHELPELQRPEYERIRGQTTRVEDSESDEEDEDREIEKTDKEAEGEDGKQLEGPHYTKVGRNYRLANGGTIEGQQRCSFCKAHGLLCVPATGSACAGCYGNRATKNTIGACNRPPKWLIEPPKDIERGYRRVLDGLRRETLRGGRLSLKNLQPQARKNLAKENNKTPSKGRTGEDDALEDEDEEACRHGSSVVSVAAWRPALKRKRKRKRARTFDQEEIPVEQQEKVMEPPRKRVTFAADLIEAGSSRVQETLTNVLDGSQPDTHQAAPVQRTGLSPNSVRGEVPLSRSAGIVLESRPRPLSGGFSVDRPLGRRLRDLLPRPSQDFLRTLEATERALAGSLNEALPLDGISQEDACLRFYLDMGLLNVFSDVYRWFD